MKRFLVLLLIISMLVPVALAQDSQATLRQIIDEGYLPAHADGSLGEEEPVDRFTFANTIARLLQAIEQTSPQAQEELLRNLTVQLQAELARMLVQTKQFEESLARLQAASHLAQDDLVEVTAQSQKLTQDFQDTYQKLEGLEANLTAMEQSSQNLSGEIASAREQFQKELLENKGQLAQIEGQIAKAQEISEATFQRQGEMLSELEERANTLRVQSQELASLTQALEKRSEQLGGQLDLTAAALHENVNKLQLDLSTTMAQLRYTDQKLDLEKKATAKSFDELTVNLKTLEQELLSQRGELAGYQEQSRRRGKLGLAFSAVAVPLLLLFLY